MRRRTKTRAVCYPARACQSTFASHLMSFAPYTHANLISNAVTYSPRGSDIDVTLTDTQRWIKVAVQDQGIGIPDEEIPHLFDPFHRAANAKSFRGTGLGLSIVKQAVEICGGSVQVESDLEQGSRFVVQFPRIGEQEIRHGGLQSINVVLTMSFYLFDPTRVYTGNIMSCCPRSMRRQAGLPILLRSRQCELNHSVC